MSHAIKLPAGQIPLGSTVRKSKGNTEYVLADELVVWRRDTKDKTRERKIEVNPESDEVLLLAPGYAQIESKDAELVWIASPQEFAAYASSREDVEATPLTI